MIRLRVLDILKEQNKTKYWLYKRLDFSYQNLNNMLENRTVSIKYETMEKFCAVLGCSIGELFEQVQDSPKES